jgi:hypothetical protein
VKEDVASKLGKVVEDLESDKKAIESKMETELGDLADGDDIDAESSETETMTAKVEEEAEGATVKLEKVADAEKEEGEAVESTSEEYGDR